MRERSRLIEWVRLLLNQRQVAQRINDHVLTFMAAWVPGDHLVCPRNHYFMHISFDQHFAVAMVSRRRVIVSSVAVLTEWRGGSG